MQHKAPDIKAQPIMFQHKYSTVAPVVCLHNIVEVPPLMMTYIHESVRGNYRSHIYLFSIQ